MGDDHDRLFRFTFAQPRHAASLLASILPHALARAVRWQHVAPLPALADETARDHPAPLSFTAPLGCGRVLLSLGHEHAATPERWPQLAALGDVVRVAERLVRAHQDMPLPPLVHVVVHHGPKAWAGPRNLFERIDLDAAPASAARILAPLQPNVHVVLDDLAALPEAALRGRPVTALARTTLLLLRAASQAAHRDPAELAARWRDLLAAIAAGPDARPALRALWRHAAALLGTPRGRLRDAATSRRSAAGVRSRMPPDRRPPHAEPD